jgi:hypothetical protein
MESKFEVDVLRPAETVAAGLVECGAIANPPDASDTAAMA